LNELSFQFNNRKGVAEVCMGDISEFARRRWTAFSWLVVVAFLALGIWWLFRLPTVGKGGLFLAVGATLMPLFWEKVGIAGRMSWIAMLFVLLAVEYRAIDKEHHNNDIAQQRALETIGNEFTGVLTDQQNGFAALIGKSDKAFKQTTEQASAQFNATMDRAQENINHITGGNSFCLITLSADHQTLLLDHPGDYPLTDLSIDIQDYALGHEEHFERQTVPPHHSWPYRYTLTEGDRADFLIVFTAINGGWFETFQLRKIDGVWRQALKVERFPKRVKLDGTMKARIIYERVDPLYPGAAAKDVKWCKFTTTKPRSEPNPYPCPDSQKK